MTRAEFIDLAGSQVHGDGCELNEFEIAAIMAAIGTAVSYLVSECLDKITHKDVSRPNRMQRWRLRLHVGQAVGETTFEGKFDKAPRAPCGTGHRIDEVYDALLCAGRALSEEQFEALKANLQSEAKSS